MSKKIELGREGKLRPMLKGLFKKYVAKKMEESSRKMAYYFRLFPFLKDWVVDEKERITGMNTKRFTLALVRMIVMMRKRKIYTLSYIQM